MDLFDPETVARDASQEALHLIRQYGAHNSADVLRIYASAFLFMLNRVSGTEEVAHAIQRISAKLVAPEDRKLRVVVSNTAKVVG